MLLRKTLLYVPAGALGPLLQIVNIVVLTHWLTPAAVGLHALLLAVQDLLHLVALLWWSQYVLRYLAPPTDGLRVTQDRTELMVMSGAALLQIAASAGLTVLLAGDAWSLGLLAAVSISTALRSVVVHWTARVRAEQRIGLFTLVQVGAPALSLAVMLVLFSLGQANVTAVFVGLAIGNGVFACILGPSLRMQGEFGPVDAAVVRTAVRYGAFTTIGAILAWISLQSVRFTTDALLGTAAVGLMSVGWGIGQRIAQQLASLATTAIFPIAVERARTHGLASGLSQLSAGGTLLLAVVLPATAGTVMLAAPLANLLTAEPFREVTTMILPLAMITGAVRVLRHNYLDEVFQLVERPALMARLDAVEAVSTVLFCAGGALWFGLEGSVIGCLVAAALTTLIALVRVRSVPDFSIDWWGSAKVAAGTAMMTAVLIMIPKPAEASMLILVVVAGALTYSLSIFAIARGDLVRLLLLKS